MAHVTADVASLAARRALDGSDIVYHLAAQVWQGRGDEGLAAMHATNVQGTANVVAADVGAVVLASSAAVYGAWPDNPLPMDEGQVPRPNPECPYAQHKLLAEMVTAESAVPWCTVRLSAVLGPHADGRVARAVQGLRLVVPAVRGVRQAVQWMDEEDAVSGLLAAGGALVKGAAQARDEIFNLAPGDWLGAHDVARVSGGNVVQLARGMLMTAAQLGRTLRLAPFGPDRAVLINGPLAVSPSKAGARLGWAASRSSHDVLASALLRGWREAPRNRRY